MNRRLIFIKNSLHNFSGYIYTLIASFVSIPILLSNLGESSFGSYLVISSIIPISSIFDLGISQAVIRKLSLPGTTKPEKAKTIQAALPIYLKISIATSLFAFLATGYLSRQYLRPNSSFSLAFVIAVSVLFNQMLILFSTTPQSMQKFKKYNVRRYLIGSNVAIAAIVSHFSSSLLLMFGLQMFTYFLVLVIFTIFSVDYLGKSIIKPKRNKIIEKDLLSFGLKHFVGTLTGQIDSHLSKFVIASKISPASVSIFSVPQSIFQKGAGLINQIGITFFPLSSSMTEAKDRERLKRFFIYVQILIFSIGVLSYFIVAKYGFNLLNWWLKDSSFVLAVYPITRVLSLYFILISLTGLPSKLLDSFKLPHIPSIAGIIHTTIYITLLLILTPKHGAIGPAYALLATSLITVPPYTFYSYLRIFYPKKHAYNSKNSKSS